MPSRDLFDGAAFYAALDRHRLTRQVSWRQVMREAGLKSPSTTGRLRRGEAPNLENLTLYVRPWSL